MHKYKTNSNHLIVKEKGKSLIVPFDNIIKLVADGNYTWISTENEDMSQNPLLCTFCLGKLLSQLDGCFIRINRGNAINIHYIKGFTHTNPVIIILKDGSELTVSRRRKKEVLIKIRNRLGN